MTLFRLPRLAVALLAALATDTAAQGTDPSTNAAVRDALARIRSDNAWTIEQQVSICEVPAPPFMEEQRGAEMKRRFEALGFRNVRIDSIGNVIAERPGTGGGPVVVIAAHLDTVFPEETDVSVTREGTTLRGPGIGDDCRGLAVLLAVAKAMSAANVSTTGTIYFVANVGEEGPGNLRGVKHLFEKPPAKIDYFISVDGTGLGLTSRAVGSNRYRVSFKGPGGHSYGAFGMTNPIHAMGRAIARIAEIQVPRSPRTTFSVGIVEGGTSVNTISPLGQMDVDLRSESPDELAKLDAQFKAAVQAALVEERARWPQSRAPVDVEIETIGIRPAAAPPDSSTIIRAAQAAARTLGFEAPGGASSTDANWPMSLGIQAITIDGGGQGRGAHSVTESYDDGDRGWLGPQWALLVITRLSGVR
jgi:acetylornithine deacetylase/succinyl-diaminopimelate desuccinylase-like protein